MTWVVPRELEDAVYEAARGVVGDAALAATALARAVVDRSKRYTSERGRAPADRTADLAARAAFFTIADAIKIAIPLAELAGRGALPERRPLRVVDLGAGCGAMSLGLVASVVGGFEITAIDRDADALRIAAAALRTVAPDAAVVTRTGDVASSAIPPADLIAIGSVLNELPPDRHLGIAERALAALPDDGALIIIEPALRDTARALEQLRDALIARGVHVFAPCTRRVAPCPMLATDHDWCHEDRQVELPPRTAELARVTHLRDAGLKFSYLVLRRAPLALVDRPAAWRVVSAPHAEKGKLTLEGCSDAGLVPLRLLRRHRNAANRPFERARRGDVVVVADHELMADTAVELVSPSSREES